MLYLGFACGSRLTGLSLRQVIDARIPPSQGPPSSEHLAWSMMVHTHNASTSVVEAGGPWISGHEELA